MIYATMGGVTVGLGTLIWYVTKVAPNWKSVLKDPFGSIVGFVPFIFGWCYGALGVLTLGGLIGWVFDSALWITNWLGDVALMWGVGAEAGVTSRGTYLPLTTYGSCVMLLLTLLTLGLIKFRRCGPEVKLGVFCGLGLGTSGGMFGLAAVPLAQAANWLGELVYVYWQTRS